MHQVQKFIPLVARFLIAIPLIDFGLFKFNNFEMLVGWMDFKGFPIASVLLTLAILIEIGGGLLLLIGLKVRPVAIIIGLYLIPVLFGLHDFWTLEGAERQSTLESFEKGIIIMGAMLYIFAFGAGGLSLDKRLEKKASESSA